MALLCRNELIDEIIKDYFLEENSLNSLVEESLNGEETDENVNILKITRCACILLNNLK